MWAIFCACNETALPGTWRRLLRVGPVILARQAQAPHEAEPAATPGEAPAEAAEEVEPAGAEAPLGAEPAAAPGEALAEAVEK